MSKVFEDYFSEIQADMVSICLEYVGNRAEKIYVHCISEDTSIFCNFFYKINGIIVKKHKLNDALSSSFFVKKYNTSINRQDAVLDILIADVEKLIDVCTQHKKNMPNEIRLYYDVKKNSLDAHYRYDSVCTESGKSEIELANEWFDKVSSRDDM